MKNKYVPFFLRILMIFCIINWVSFSIAQTKDFSAYFDLLHMWWPIDAEKPALNALSDPLIEMGVTWELSLIHI